MRNLIETAFFILAAAVLTTAPVGCKKETATENQSSTGPGTMTAGSKSLSIAGITYDLPLKSFDPKDIDAGVARATELLRMRKGDGIQWTNASLSFEVAGGTMALNG